jgi:sterol 14-demethylase
LDDLKRRLNALAESGEGITDPFDSIYEIVFQLTMRTVGCNEVADDPVLLKKTFVYNQAVEYTSTPAAIMFPWFPSPGILKRLWAGTRMYMLFDKVIKDRKNTGRREDDALQFMMDQGDGTKDVITVVFGSLFAGLLNSGINAAWILVYLAVYPEWLSKIREEVVATAAKHSADPKAPLVDQLSSLPIEIWESGFPLLDLCLRDSIRLQLVGAAFRKNATNHDIKVGNATIPPGVFVTYPLADIHHDQDVYLDSHSWDPSRYFPDRAEDKKKPYAYLGWGVGRHPCGKFSRCHSYLRHALLISAVGMRFAKLENNIITAFWLAMFDYELVDGKGNLTRQLPNVNINAFTAHKPNPKVYFKYKVRK